jgi:hypothetical protein
VSCLAHLHVVRSKVQEVARWCIALTTYRWPGGIQEAVLAVGYPASSADRFTGAPLQVGLAMVSGKTARTEMPETGQVFAPDVFCGSCCRCLDRIGAS